jgi:hypothetical protein
MVLQAQQLNPWMGVKREVFLLQCKIMLREMMTDQVSDTFL